jgi:RND family efflux transporter MFP subunit
MNTHMTRLSLLSIGVALFLWRCSSHSKPEKLSLDERKKRVEQLRQEVLRLQAQITDLEASIQAEDSTYGRGKQIPVGYTVLQPRRFVTALQFQGAVDNRQVVTLAAKSAGSVVRLFVQEGQRVSAGQVLLEQEAEVLRKNLAEVRTRLELARTLYEKQKKLYEEGIGSEVQYLTAKNNKEALEATVATLEEQLRNTQIRAPFAGTIDAVQAKVGELLVPGVPAIRLVSTGQWEIRAEIPEAYLQLARPGQPVEVHIPDLNLSFSSQVAAASENISPLSRTLTVIIRDIPPSYRSQLRPNLIAYVRLQEKELPQALVLPTEAIQFQDSVAFVYLYKGGVARKKRVHLVGTQGAEVAVAGLSAGDTVVTIGASLLSEGQPISLSSAEGL